MGVPKFFRWISERYPKINQPIHAPPDPETRTKYFPSYKAPGDEESSSERNTKSKAKQQDDKVYIQKNSITPEFDRLYLDMNGIIHCSSHNNASDDNATIDPDTHIENSDPTAVHESNTSEADGTVTITEAEIFRNVCYYVDRVVTDIAKPTELVYMAIDGVAPRAKMNQQRSRRYRSGKEREIENTFHGANLLAQKKREEEMSFNVESEYDNEFWNIEGGMDRLSDSKRRTPVDDGNKNVHLEEVEPGRYTGTFETSKNDEKSSPFDVDYEEFLKTIENDDRSDEDGEALTSFHSNTITPGTPFFERCTEHLQHFVKRKLHGDPRWKDLTIVFSGPDVPGEGEHKIMDFIRRQKQRKDYDPNTTHCMFGQDGDLIMLGLATHEPHFALLREEVVFDPSRKRDQKKLAESSARMQGDGKNDAEGKSSEKVSASIDTYIHNSNFEVLHMPILRDYLSYEFETKDVLPNSPFELEQTIDDFVFMTFIVGNDFLVSISYQFRFITWLITEFSHREIIRSDTIAPYACN
jgi:5'-3' exonuclease